MCDVKIPIFHGSQNGLHWLVGKYNHPSYDGEMSAFIIITRIFQITLKALF